MYTDPTGHSWKSFFKKWGSTILSAAAIVAAPFSGGLSLALFAASTVMGGVQAYQQGQFGAWAAGFAVSMALGGMMPTPSFGNLGMQVGVGALRGAAIGAISGGIASMVGGGSFGAGAAQGAIGGAAGGGIGSFMTSQQMGNWRAGNGFVNNATAARIANMRASLGTSRDAMVSATRSAQAAENGVAGSIGADLRAPSVYPEDILGGLSSYCDVVGPKARGFGLGFQVGEAVLGATGTAEMTGGIVGGVTGWKLGSALGTLGGPGGSVIGGVIGACAGSYILGNLSSRFDNPGAGSLNYNEWEGYNGS